MAEQTATIQSRVDKLTIPQLVGLTVAQAKDRFRSVINIAANAYPTVNGVAVDPSHVIRAGETVVFQVALGEKGYAVFTFVA